MRDALPWVTTVTGAVVMYLAGRSPRSRRAAWYLGVANQIPWIAYAVIAKSWGFVPGSLLYGTVYVRNILRKGD
jgi:hypothetical protein